MKKFGLLGENISYSFSPILHKKICNFINVEATYDLFDISSKELNNFIKYAKKNNLSGFNVTIPYKKEIIKYLDEITPEAKSIGAVNCVKNINGKLIGYNTDFFGLIATFKKMGIILKSKNIFILGSGGAATTAYEAVLSLSGIPTLVSRKPENNVRNTISYTKLRGHSGYLLINATPVGTYPEIDISPVEEECILNFDYLLDLIYNPNLTKFLSFGKKHGKHIENGLYMLVTQAVQSQNIWNEINVDSQPIYDIIKKDMH